MGGLYDSTYTPPPSATKRPSRPADSNTPLQPRRPQAQPAGSAYDCTPDPTSPTSMYAERGSFREDSFAQTSTPVTAHKAPLLRMPSSSNITAIDSSRLQTGPYSPGPRSQDYSTLHNYSIPLKRSPTLGSKANEWPSSYTSFDTSAEEVSTTIFDSQVYRPGRGSRRTSNGSGEKASATLVPRGEEVSTTLSDSWAYQPAEGGRVVSSAAARREIPYSPSRLTSPGEETCDQSKSTQFYTLKPDTRDSSTWNRDVSVYRREPAEGGRVGSSAAARREIPYSPSRLTSLEETSDQSTQFNTLKTDTRDSSTWNLEDPAHRRLVTPNTIGVMHSNITPQKSDTRVLIRTPPPDTPVTPSTVVPQPDGGRRKLSINSSNLDQTLTAAPPRADPLEAERWDTNYERQQKRRETSQPDGGRRKLSFHASYVDETLALPPSRDGALEAKRLEANYERQQQREKLAQPDGGKRKLSFHASYLDETLTLPPSRDDALEAKRLEANYERQQQREKLAQPDEVRRKLNFNTSYLEQTLAAPPSRDEPVEPKRRDTNVKGQQRRDMLYVLDSELPDTTLSRELTIISPFPQKKSSGSLAARFDFEPDSSIDRANGFCSPQDFKDSTRSSQRRREISGLPTGSSSDLSVSNLSALSFTDDSNQSDNDTLTGYENASLSGSYKSSKKTHKNAPTKTIENVKNLTASTFSNFLKNQEMVVVMFHNSTTDRPGAVGSWTTHSLKAPQGVNPAFASVDCGTETELCAKEAITANPFFKLYSGGQLVNAVKDFGLLNF